MKKDKTIFLKNVREHNLKNITLSIPRNKFVVITGVSGSGKSSLAIDTIFKEGQRRYIASLSAYARQFMSQIDRPNVDLIEGLSPTICIDQKSVGRNPRSTVGTITEVYDFLRLLYARLGIAHCPKGHGPIAGQNVEMITNHLYEEFSQQDILIMAPIVVDRKGEYRKEIQQYHTQGFVRVLINGLLHRLEETPDLERYEKHRIEIVVDRITLLNEEKARILESVKKALAMANGLVSVLKMSALSQKEPTPEIAYEAQKKSSTSRLQHSNEDYRMYNKASSCVVCGYSLPEFEPRLFSFNAPQGECSHCKGLGYKKFFDSSLCVKNENKSIFDGALYVLNDDGNVLFWGSGRGYSKQQIKDLFRYYKLDVNTLWMDLPTAFKERIFSKKYGSKVDKYHKDNLVFDIMGGLNKLYDTYKIPFLEKYMTTITCPECSGKRLNEVALGVVFCQKSIVELVSMSVKNLLDFFQTTDFSAYKDKVFTPIANEIIDRLAFMMNVGLEYLTLERRANTLSGGESQRIRLASQIGSGLEGCLYILDEPSIGLHQSDNQKLIATLKKLRDNNNTVIVIEHDEETMLSADYLVDIGPGAGVLGGEVCYANTPDNLLSSKISKDNSIKSTQTLNFLTGTEVIAMPSSRRSFNVSDTFNLNNIKRFNVQGIDVLFPLGVFTVVTGVSGSGKSTLLEILSETFERVLTRHVTSATDDGECATLRGGEIIKKIIEVNQRPIGRTSRSNPATYTKAWDLIRDLFALLPESKVRGYQKGRFSFNVTGGRCEGCGGSGVLEIDMQIFSRTQVVCEDCNGKRFNSNTLDIHYRGKNIYHILEMSAMEAHEFFKDVPRLNTILSMMVEIGLGYITLGQPSPTLSGGEAQRIKLVSELSKSSQQPTIYLLDEPTTGLHFSDIQKLLDALQKLLDKNQTIIVIEHNLEIIKAADYIIEMGPGGGESGGRIIATGTPEQLATKNTPTGIELKIALERHRKREKQFYATENNFKTLLKEFATDNHKNIGFQNDKSTATSKQDDNLIGPHIVIRELFKNNLKNINLDLPKNKIIVFTGVSGSGKSSLALDTIFQEGQRRYIESLSTYARRFLGRIPRANAKRISGISPTIAVDQKTGSKNPRSTIATQTEIYDSFRVMFANIGKHHCQHCNKPILAYTTTTAAKDILANGHLQNRLLLITAPLYVQGSSKRYLLESLSKLPIFRSLFEEKGFLRILIDNQLFRLDDKTMDIDNIQEGDATSVHLVVDRVQVTSDNTDRIISAFENAFAMGDGIAMAQLTDDTKINDKSKNKSNPSSNRFYYGTFPLCFEHNVFYEEKLSPRHFSFNNHLGACIECEGLGNSLDFSEENFIVSTTQPLFKGGIERLALVNIKQAFPLRANTLTMLASQKVIDVAKVSYDQLNESEKQFLFYGKPLNKDNEVTEDRRWLGFRHAVLHIAKTSTAQRVRSLFVKYLRYGTCLECGGGRLKPDYLAIKIANTNMKDLSEMTLQQAHDFFEKLPAMLNASEKKIVKEVLDETQFRLTQMLCLGMHYLTLNRNMGSLSGGEVQRIRLSTQIGNKLNDVIYVLDEPTIGLHERDIENLFAAIKNLQAIGNTVLLVEHDGNIIKKADWIVDIGPNGGVEGGKIIYNGVNDKTKLASTSFYPYLYDAAAKDKANKNIYRQKQPPFNIEEHSYLQVQGVCKHNLKNVDCLFPLERLVGISGVSGSGKSSLVFDWLRPRLEEYLKLGKIYLKGGEAKVVLNEHHQKTESPIAFLNVIDQSPISKSLRSTVASYLDILTPIRDVFANTRDAKMKNFDAGHFSYNSSKGRCSLCNGTGAENIEMHFISDVQIVCDQCNGKRYRHDVLEIFYKQKNIDNILNMTLAEAYDFFSSHKRHIQQKISLMLEAGLGYLKLGITVSVLSGGELQRLKIVKEIASKNLFEQAGRTLYLIDEPTTGLHFKDTEKLIAMLDKLIQQGNSIFVIEHNLEFLRNVDYLIDMGPEGGDGGGELIAFGTTEQVKHSGVGYTSKYL